VGNCCTSAECTSPSQPICVNRTCAPCTSDGQCGSDQRCCAGRCVAGVCCDAAECGPRGNLCVSAGGGPTSCICGSGGSLCAESQTCCPTEAGPANAGACVNLQTSPAHCGQCGTACGPNFVCEGGQCVCPDVGFTRCGTACIPAGGCCVDGDCPSGQTCQGAECVCHNDANCGVCRECVGGRCQPVPDNTFTCIGAPLGPDGCGNSICRGGRCDCGLSGVLNPLGNSCACNEEGVQICVEFGGSNQCCLPMICANGTHGNRCVTCL
jgi:hypothetical protein